jgi:hypothetical protein
VGRRRAEAIWWDTGGGSHQLAPAGCFVDFGQAFPEPRVRHSAGGSRQQGGLSGAEGQQSLPTPRPPQGLPQPRPLSPSFPGPAPQSSSSPTTPHLTHHSTPTLAVPPRGPNPVPRSALPRPPCGVASLVYSQWPQPHTWWYLVYPQSCPVPAYPAFRAAHPIPLQQLPERPMFHPSLILSPTPRGAPYSHLLHLHILLIILGQL